MEPGGAYSELEPKEKEYEPITERDLVDFARQIAAGMVSKRRLVFVICSMNECCWVKQAAKQHSIQFFDIHINIMCAE